MGSTHEGARQTNEQPTSPHPARFLDSDRHGRSRFGQPLLQQCPLAVRCVAGRRATQADFGPPAASTPGLPQGCLSVRQLADSGRGTSRRSVLDRCVQKRVRRAGEAGRGHHAMQSSPLDHAAGGDPWPAAAAPRSPATTLITTPRASGPRSSIDVSPEAGRLVGAGGSQHRLAEEPAGKCVPG